MYLHKIFLKEEKLKYIIDTNTYNNIHDRYQQYNIYLNMPFLSKLPEDNHRWVWLVCIKIISFIGGHQIQITIATILL